MVKPGLTVAIKSITKKNIAKSQNLLGKEIKILKVSAGGEDGGAPGGDSAPETGLPLLGHAPDCLGTKERRQLQAGAVSTSLGRDGWASLDPTRRRRPFTVPAGYRYT
ncbi:hypothetical protein C7M84_011222 [Penaeus vannamei]|uniref:Uncharacterized protein n=1 Tax=Penaeus vannamei TaxID=6689 RepID=A0A3R7QKP5_PENVA|nr:hypothetical protein C7M84_011222 [Penaeus vannamei]